jgi:hypothetical protein
MGRPTFSLGTELFDRLGLVLIALYSEAVERACACQGRKEENVERRTEVQ